MPLPSAGAADCSSGLAQRIFQNLSYDSRWIANKAGYAVGARGCPTVPNGFGYQVSAISTGSTGSSEPTWPVIINNTVVDGGVTWKCIEVANPDGRVLSVNPGYVLTTADLDGFRLLAYDIAKAIADELAADNEAWITVGGTGVSFAATWSNFGGGYAVAAYFKDANGFVHVKGIVKCSTSGGGAGSTIFTLPSGYRPSETHQVPAQNYTSSVSQYGLVTINTDGTLVATQFAQTLTGGNLSMDLLFDTR